MRKKNLAATEKLQEMRNTIFAKPENAFMQSRFARSFQRVIMEDLKRGQWQCQLYMNQI